MASELRVNTLKDASGNNSVATSVVFSGTPKSWVNFDQNNASSTAEIRQSFNTSGITDEGTGLSAVSYTNNFNYADYGIGSAFNRTGTDDFLNTYYNHTTALTNYQHYSSGSSADSDDMGAIVCGDLA